MKLSFFVAWRYLRAKRKGLFAVVTTVIGIAGVTVGVAALITTLSVMNGFQTDIQKKIIGAQSHLTVYGVGSGKRLKEARAAALEDEAVKAVAPFVVGQAIISFKGRSSGVVLKGLDPELEFTINDLGRFLVEGRWKDIEKRAPPGIVLGVELAEQAGAWLGDEVILTSPQGAATPLGLLPKMEKFRIAGILRTGYYEYDSTMAYAAIAPTSRFFGLENGPTGLGIRLKDLSLAEKAAERLRLALGPGFVVRTYGQMNRTLFAALKLEKAVMFIILTLIILVAALNIASNLILRSVEKTRDIGLLKAMGATPGLIRGIFLVEGLLIGAMGLSLGLALGLGLCWVIGRYPIVELPADIYYLSRVPVSVDYLDVISVMAVGLLLSLLATAYPAHRAAKVDAVEAIHYG